jgi:hypothetical protein
LRPETLLLANLTATLFLTGLAWFLQVVHLPLMPRVAEGEFASYARIQRARNTALMAPTMLVELFTAAALALSNVFMHRYLVYAAVLVAIIWVDTFAFIVPANSRLTKGFDGGTLRALVWSNWTRTICWTLRAVIVIKVAYGPYIA